jgi:hypothetical protein
MMVHIMKLFYRRALRRACYHMLMGRVVEPGHAERGRILRRDVDEFLAQTWRNVDALLPDAELERLPTIGNRHNVFLAVITIAAYQALVAKGFEREYALQLLGDVGWKLYVAFLPVPRLIARVVTRDPQKRLNLILRMLLRFPFSAPGRPGYEVVAWAERGCFHTHWTHCPPYDFVRRHVERHGDAGELEAFRASWCAYDWAVTYAMVENGGDTRGRYERPHTLSSGDDVCDMCWYAKDDGRHAASTSEKAHM